MEKGTELARLTARWAIAIALVALPFVVAAAQPKASTRSSIGGTVLTASRAPVPNAVVTVWRNGKSIATVPVAPTGQFSYATREGTYEVQAAAPGFHPVVTVRITVVVHAKAETWVNITMAPGS
jgi:hypothetical protein